MIPGLTPNAYDALSRLPAEYDRSTPNPLRELANGIEDIVYLMVGLPYDPINGREELVTLATRPYASHGSPTTLIDGTVIPAHRLFRARLMDAYNVSLNVMPNGALAQAVSPSAGGVSINLAYGDLDRLTRLSWAGRRLMILAGNRTKPLDEFTAIFRGTTEKHSANFARLTLPAQDPSARYATALQKNLYKGYGNAIRLNGSSDFISSAALAATTNLTFEMRFRCRGSNGAGTAQILAAHGAGWSSTSTDWYLQIGTDGKLSAVVHRSSGATQSFIGATDLRDVQWHHVALTVNGTTKVSRFHLDGELIGTLAAPDLTATTGSLWIGTLVDAVSNFCRVDVDDIRLWSTLRTPSEILANRDGKLIGTEDGLRLYWRCEEGTGAVVQDETTANLDGNLTATSLPAAWIGSGEGGDELKGKPKPLWYGWREQSEVVWIDGLHNVFQRHDSAIQGFTRAYDKGNGTALVYDGDVATHDLLYSTTVAAGHWISCHALGLGRTGIKPDGILTVDGDGDKTGGTYASTMSDIFRRMAERHCGASYPVSFDVGALAAVNTLLPAAWGWSSGLDVVNSDEAFNSLTAPFATWGHTRTELLTLFAPSKPGVPVATITDRDLKLNRLQPIEVPTSPSAVKVGYRPYDLTQTSDLSTSLSQQQKEDLAAQYRYVLSEDSAVLGRSVKERHSLADTMIVNAAFKYEADAKVQGDRWLELFQDCVSFEIPLIKGLFQYRIGDTVSVALSRLLTGGVPVLIVGYTENVGGNDIRLMVWGPTVIAEHLNLLIGGTYGLRLVEGGPNLILR